MTLSSSGRPMGHVAMVSVSQGEVMWPDMVAMDRLVVNKPEIWVYRNESGHFVGLGARKGDSPKPTPMSESNNIQSEAATTPTQWRIGTIVVRGGTVHLEDRSVTPVYSDMLEHFEMTLDDFMSTPDHPVMIAARADIASGGALALQGRAALLGPTPSLSLKASIHRMVLPSTNPYLKRTVSHYTTDGTLTTAMDIRLSDDRLEITSDVTLSDLQVEPIQDSTHRTVQERIGLPLGLLITLLKDDAGRIVITFPVSGPLSNPSFDWTNAVWATLRNAVVKLITLPIRSIGRFVMGGHQHDELALDPIILTPVHRPFARTWNASYRISRGFFVRRIVPFSTLLRYSAPQTSKLFGVSRRHPGPFRTWTRPRQPDTCWRCDEPIWWPHAWLD